jgi:hypothetical protein
LRVAAPWFPAKAGIHFLSKILAHAPGMTPQ